MAAVVKKALVLVVVILVILIGLPVLMPGMGGVHCNECGPATLSSMCVAVLAATIFAAMFTTGWRRRFGVVVRRGRVVAFLLERPPQVAFVL